MVCYLRDLPGLVTQLMNQLMNDKGVCRTGSLIYIDIDVHIEPWPIKFLL